MASTVEEVQPPILSEVENKKEQSDEVEIEFVTPALQLTEPIKLTVSKKLLLAEVKKLITEQHPEKPPPVAMKIIYKGRQLQDDIIIGDAINIGLSGSLLGGSQAKFHLLIDKRKVATNGLQENKADANTDRNQAPQPRRMMAAETAPPRRDEG